MANPGYFGVRLGEAIAGGAKHISDALQRRYEMEKLQEQQRLGTGLALAKEGVVTPSVQMPGGGGMIDFSEIAMRNQEKLRQAQIDADLERQKTRAEIAKLGEKKAPTDFRWTPSGDLEPIPGSKTDIKTMEANTKKREAQQAFVGDIDLTLDAIQKAKENVGYMSTGMIGGKFDSTPQAGRLEGYIRTINSLIGLGKLKEMKQQSATGASGFGQLSNQELQLLTSSIASLDRKILDPKTMKENLDTIESTITKWKERTMAKMGGEQGTPDNMPSEMAPAPIALPADKAKRLMELRAKAGR